MDRKIRSKSCALSVNHIELVYILDPYLHQRNVPWTSHINNLPQYTSHSQSASKNTSGKYHPSCKLKIDHWTDCKTCYSNISIFLDQFSEFLILYRWDWGTLQNTFISWTVSKVCRRLIKDEISIGLGISLLPNLHPADVCYSVTEQLLIYHVRPHKLAAIISPLTERSGPSWAYYSCNSFLWSFIQIMVLFMVPREPVYPILFKMALTLSICWRIAALLQYLSRKGWTVYRYAPCSLRPLFYLNPQASLVVYCSQTLVSEIDVLWGRTALLFQPYRTELPRTVALTNLITKYYWGPFRAGKNMNKTWLY